MKMSILFDASLDEVFGSENFVSLITFSKTRRNFGAASRNVADYHSLVCKGY